MIGIGGPCNGLVAVVIGMIVMKGPLMPIVPITTATSPLQEPPMPITIQLQGPPTPLNHKGHQHQSIVPITTATSPLQEPPMPITI